MVLMYPYRGYSQVVDVYVLCNYSVLSDSIDTTFLPWAVDENVSLRSILQEEDEKAAIVM